MGIYFYNGFSRSRILMSDNTLSHKILQSSPVGYATHKIVYSDSGEPCDYIVLDINQAFEKMTTLKQTDVVGQSLSELSSVLSEFKFPWINIFNRAVRSKKDQEINYYVTSLNSWIKTKIYQLDKMHLITLSTEITNEAKQINMYETLLESMSEIVIEFSESLDINNIWLARSMAEQGITHEIIIKTVTDLIHQIDPYLEAQFQKAWTIDETVTFDYHYQMYDIDRWFNVEMFTQENHISEKCLVAVVKDVHDRVLTENELKVQNQFLNRLITNLPGMVYRCAYMDGNMEIEYVRGLCYELTGYQPEEMINSGRSGIDLIQDEYKEQTWLNQLTHLNNHTMFQNEFPITTKSGQTKWVWQQGVGVYDDKGEVIAIEGFITDITERKMADLDLHNEKELLRITLQSIGDAVIATDENGKITMMNKIAEEITCWRQEDCIGLDFDVVFNICNKATNQRCESPIKQVLETGQVVDLQDDTILITRDGSHRDITDSAAPIRGSSGDIYGIIVVFRDVTKNRLLQKEIHYINYHDRLTGLYNRAYFEQKIQQFNAKKYLPIPILMGDVNGLKLANDVYGHEAGDQLLSNIANILRNCTKDTDVIARWGGDEFVILMPNTTTAEAEETRQNIYRMCKETPNEHIALSISIGGATRTRLNENVFDVLRKAEDAMYANKLLESKNFRTKVIDSLQKTLFKNTYETPEHTARVQELSAGIGAALNLTEQRLDELKLLSVLHDVGKIAIKESILSKPGPLSAEEWVEMKKHPEIGYRIAQTVPELVPIAEAILSHHERWDGNGYPQGLTQKNIPLTARIVSICVAYDVMTNDQVYKNAIEPKAALAEIAANAGSQFDPNLVGVFLKLMTVN